MLSAGSGIAVIGQQACPEIDLLLPNGVIEAEASATVVARLSGGFDYSSSALRWSLSKGKIASGQGTAAITFVTSEDDEGTNIKVTLSVGGLPPHCRSVASDLIGIASLPIGEPVDTLGKIGSTKKAFWSFLSILDTYMSVVINSPNYEGVITVEFNRKDKRQEKVRHLKRILNHFGFRKFDLTRITFAVSEGNHPERTTLWTMPPDAKYPKYARDFQKIKAEEFNKKIKDLFPNKQS